ncbi:MAG: hypothetical protein ACXWCH_34490, partial [Burkholderiales bacterium]
SVAGADRRSARSPEFAGAVSLAEDCLELCGFNRLERSEGARICCDFRDLLQAPIVPILVYSVNAVQAHQVTIKARPAVHDLFSEEEASELEMRAKLFRAVVERRRIIGAGRPGTPN